jgi:hypothetical protein
MKRMYNAGKIIVGILIFLGVFTFPVLYNKITTGPPPKLELPAKEKECVMPTPFMKASHMELLNEWRDQVVREGNRTFVNPAGVKFTMSLSSTCMKCHTSKVNFCDRCHNYLSVSPKCWDCHIEPKEPQAGRAQ